MNKPACLLTMILAACGGGGEDQAVSADPAPVNAPAAAAPTPAPSPTPAAPVAAPAPVAAAPVAQPPAAQPPAAPTPVARPAPPVAEPTPAAPPAQEPVPAPPAAEPDDIEVLTMGCRQTPSPLSQVDTVVQIEINYSGDPWKWAKASSPVPFSTDPDGSQGQQLSGDRVYVPAGTGKAAYYFFDSQGLRAIETQQMSKNDYPYVCVRP